MSAGRLTELYETYGEHVAFHIVYIREAHALDSRSPMTFGLVEDPVTELERVGVASKCVEELDLPMPALVDGLDDRVNQAYKGWPDRLYLVDAQGRIAYAGGRGPFFFSPDELEVAVRKVLDARPPAPAPAQEPAPTQDPGGDRLAEVTARLRRAHLGDQQIEPTDFEGSLVLSHRAQDKDIDVQLDVRFKAPSLIRYRVEEGGKTVERGRDGRGMWHQLDQSQPPQGLGAAELAEDRDAVMRDIRLARQLLEFLDPAGVVARMRGARVGEAELTLARGKTLRCTTIRGEVDGFPLYVSPDAALAADGRVQLEVFIDPDEDVLRGVRAVPVGMDRGELVLMPRHEVRSGVLLPTQLVFYRDSRGRERELLSKVRLVQLRLGELPEAGFDRRKPW